MAKRPKIRARRASPFQGDEDQPASTAVNWWTAETAEECAENAWAWCDRVGKQHTADALMDLVHDAIYRGRPVGDSASSFGQQFLLLRSGVLINLNVVMSIVDTANARFTKRRPFPVISADNAGWTEKGFAEEASRVLRRKLAVPQLERENPLVIGDMLRRGDGCMKLYIEDGDVAYKRIPIYEVLVDPSEAEHDAIRTWAHVRPEPRDVMAARYPAFEREINEVQQYRSTLAGFQQQSVSDMIEVRELWHMPTSAKKRDGLWVEAIKGCVVRSRRWRHPRPPIQRCRWSVIPRMFRGGGLVEQLIGIQEQVNDILKDAREGLKFGSQLTIFMQRGAQVNKNHLRGRGPKVVEFDGAEPHYLAPNPVSEQAIRILQLLIEQAYQISGISQMAAQSKNTLGANASGKAIDTLDDLQSERFAHVEADYQQYRVLLGASTIDLAQDIADEVSGDLEPYFSKDEDVIEKAASWIDEIEWEKIEIDSGSYHLVLEPLNYLADSRAGRLSQVSELSKNGIITNPVIQADLFNEPDLQRANRTILGPKHKLDRIMSDLANPKVDLYEIAPDQYTNLDLGLEMALGELNEAESMRSPPAEILDRYRTWITLAREQKQKREAPAMAGPGGPMPPGMPAAPGGALMPMDPSALGPGAPLGMPPPIVQPSAMPQAPLPISPFPGMPTG